METLPLIVAKGMSVLIKFTKRFMVQALFWMLALLALHIHDIYIASNKGCQKKRLFFFGHPKTFFLLAKFFGCQRKSFRYRTKENFDTCPRSEDHIVTELCHFLWDPMIKIHSEIKDESFGSPKKFFLPTKSFRCQQKSFRYRAKENFDTCLRSVGLIFTEIWPFSWKQTFWSSNFFWQFLTLFSWVK